MKLKFWSKGTALVPHPGQKIMAGTIPEFVGRTWHAETMGYPAVDAPTEVVEGTDDANYLLIIARRDGDLLPADAATAALVGVPFVPHVAADGVMVPAPTP